MYTHPLHKDSSLESLYDLCEKKALVSIAILVFMMFETLIKNFYSKAPKNVTNFNINSHSFVRVYYPMRRARIAILRLLIG